MDSDQDHHPKTSPVRAYKAMHNTANEGEELYTSLSEYHDYEPNLEFDDSELLHTASLEPVPPELLDLDIEPEDALEAPVGDGTIEENFEKELGQVYSEIMFSGDEETFAALDRSGLIEVVGDDEIGRRIIVISACRLPKGPEQRCQDKLLRYLMFTLDQFVEQDYSLVYFHHGLTNENKPSLRWLWRAYKAFDRKYKKNLKALYLVHPTNFIRIVWQMLKPVISVKFGQKMMYINYLHQLQEHLNIHQLPIPGDVIDHDSALMAKNRKAASSPNQVVPDSSNQSDGTKAPAGLSPPVTQQFGVTLQFIKENNENMMDSIPPIVRQCVEYLSQPDALETEGLFRRSASITVIKDLQNKCNRGEEFIFRDDPHNAAVLLKTFLRDLEEPLMTFALYEEIIAFHTWSVRDRPRKVKILVLERLPLDNYKLLKYIVQFLFKVMDRCDLNKMTCSNLAVVFGPNLVWPQHGQMSLQAIGPINSFTEFLLDNQDTIFII